MTALTADQIELLQRARDGLPMWGGSIVTERLRRELELLFALRALERTDNCAYRLTSTGAMALSTTVRNRDAWTHGSYHQHLEQTDVDNTSLCVDKIFEVHMLENHMKPFDYRASGVANTIAAFEEVATWAEELVSSAKISVPELPNINFRFADSDEVNAYAFRRDGAYFIALTNSAISSLQLVINRLLSDPNIFPDIGNPIEEVPFFNKLAASSYEAVISGGADIHPPKNRYRNSYAGRLYKTAVIFLLGHEIAHVSLGHVDYRFDRYGICAVAENTKPTAAQVESVAREWQGIELDADRRSIRSRIHSIHQTWQSAKKENVNLREKRCEPEQLFFDVGLAINIFFRMFGDNKYSIPEQREKLHPADATRRSLAIGLAAQAAGEIWGEKFMKIASEQFTRSVLAIEDAFEYVSDEQPTRRAHSGLAQATTDAEMEATFRLLDHLDGPVRAKLEPFAYEKPSHA
jgi:hypothetical protein